MSQEDSLLLARGAVAQRLRELTFERSCIRIHSEDIGSEVSSNMLIATA